MKITMPFLERTLPYNSTFAFSFVDCQVKAAQCLPLFFPDWPQKQKAAFKNVCA